MVNRVIVDYTRFKYVKTQDGRSFKPASDPTSSGVIVYYKAEIRYINRDIMSEPNFYLDFDSSGLTDAIVCYFHIRPVKIAREQLIPMLDASGDEVKLALLQSVTSAKKQPTITVQKSVRGPGRPKSSKK